jgi:hydroxymethylglutaryl-CoA synthase
LNWVSSDSYDGRFGIVVAVDIAVYEEGPARPTGGAGAVALLIGKNAKIAINPIRATFIDNEWDFYKPVPTSEYPLVDGKFSMQLYLKALKNCYLKLKEKTNSSNLLKGNDFFCFHSPFAKMVQKAYESLLKIETPDLSEQEFLESFKKQVEPSLFLSKRHGNIYNGSLYLCLLSLLFKVPEVIGKKAMIFSYGSGLCSTLLQLEIRSNPISPLQQTRIDNYLSSRVKVSA